MYAARSFGLFWEGVNANGNPSTPAQKSIDVSKMFVRGGRPKQQPHDEVGDVKQHSDDQPYQEDSHHEIDESLHGSG